MRLVWQWVTLERELPPDWSDVQLVLKVREQDADQAAALLGGANPLRGKDSIRLFVSRTRRLRARRRSSAHCFASTGKTSPARSSSPE